MNSLPPTPSPNENGRRYWRSLDEVAETPEFRQWLEREFPEGASEWMDPVSRRHFVKIMSASFLLAGLGLAGSGCRRPVEHLEPFGRQPSDYVYGVPQYYATAMPAAGGAIPLVAKSYEGRPIKLEGNSLFPGGNGATDRWTQASILDLYDFDRSRRFLRGGNNASPEAALDFLSTLSTRAQTSGGQALSFLIDGNGSPSRNRLQKIIRRKFPKARWYVYEPVDLDIHRRAASLAFGKSVRPVFRYDAAKVILSLDGDFVGSEPDLHNSIRRFARNRRLEKPSDSLNRLYVVESLFTLTGALADHRLRVPSGAVLQVAAAFAREFRANRSNAAASVSGLQAAGIDPKWISECARDLLTNRDQALVVAGYRQPLAVHLLAFAINAALGNIGKTVQLYEEEALGEGRLADLAHSLDAGEVDTLVILNTNPVYSAPPELNWAAAQRKAKTVVRLAYHEDETTAVCDWHLPAAHYLESWGDARASDGTLLPIQPLIAPLFGGLTEIEVLARIAGEQATTPHEIVRETFRGLAGGGDSELSWRKFLYNGFLEGSAARTISGRLDRAAVAKAVADVKPVPVPSKEHLEVVFFRDYKMDDGRYNNNGWLQELPDPISKLTWDNAVLVSRRTAKDLGVQNHDLVEVKLGGRTIKGPIWIQPGQADYSLGLALGYGRPKPGRIGIGTGFNAYELRASAIEHVAAGATLRKLDGTYHLSSTQHHWSMEGRPVVREANLDQYREHPDFAQREELERPPVVQSLYPNPLKEAMKQGLHQWGMTIDLNTCVGCGTCVLACQSENNIPIVGKDLVNRGREMQWMRIDRYYASSPTKGRPPDFFQTDDTQQFAEWIDEPQCVMQPLPCQMCEAAPCENVCPVNATTHDSEGLNVMVYNRCVGTRYCSNNCPYKVRRFNYLDYNKRPLSALKGPFYPTPLLHHTDGEWDLLRWWRNPESPTAGMRPDDEWDLIKMVKNPDVTVRMRGVMEKCTYCIQRIQQAEIAAKDKARDSGDIRLKESEGTVPKTACQQACPAGAIVFGDISDPESTVSRLKARERNYSLLDSLYTRPRTTYLARVRNPNPAMPDYRAIPASLEEFEYREGNPFKGEEQPPFEKSGGASVLDGKEHAHG